jgi:hypothetical protein
MLREPPGLIRDAILVVLSEAGRPMQVCKIRATVSELLTRSVSRSSVKGLAR